MSKHEEARQARLKAEQDNLRKEQQMEFHVRAKKESGIASLRQMYAEYMETIEPRAMTINSQPAALAKEIVKNTPR